MNSQTKLQTSVPSIAGRFSGYKQMILAAVLLSVAAMSGWAQSGTWTNKASGLTWSTPANWTNATAADGSGTPGTATFNLGFTANTTNTVHLDNSFSVTNLTFGNATNASATEGWILDNNGNAANVLTLAASPTTIAVTPGAGSTLNTIISAVMYSPNGSGTGLVKSGAGALWLTGNNTYDGPLTLANNASGSSVYYNSISEVASGTPSALGQPSTTANGTIYIGSNDYFQYNGTGSPTTARNLVFTGSNGQIFNSNPSGGGTLTLTGTITNTGTTSAQCVFRNGGGAGNSIVISGALNLGTGFVLANGGGQIYLSNPANAFTNYIDSAASGYNLYFSSIDYGGQPSAAGAGTVLVAAAGAYLNYNGTGPGVTDRTFIMQGNNSQLINSSAGYSLTLYGMVTNQATSSASTVFRSTGSPLGSIYLEGPLNLGTSYFMASGGSVYLDNPTNSFTNYVTSAAGSGTLFFSSITNAGLSCAVGAGSQLIFGTSSAYMAYNGTNNTSTGRTFLFQYNNDQLKNISPNGSTLTINGLITNTVTTNGSFQTVFRGSAPLVLNGPVALGSSFFFKTDSNNVYLNNPANSFTNYVWNTQGGIYFNTISNGGLSCSLGQSGTFYFACNAQTPAGYYYTGGPAAANSTWTFATESPNTGPGYIGNDGTGTLTLNGPINAQSATMERELNFDDLSNNIVVNGPITLQATSEFEPLVGVSQRGPFTLTLNNPGNFIPGPLDIFNGTLSVNSVAAMGVGIDPAICLGVVSSPFAVYPNTTGTFQFTGASGGTINVPIYIATDLLASGTVGGVIANTVAGQTLTMSGAVTPADYNSNYLPSAGSVNSDYTTPAYLTLTGAGNGVLSAGISGSPVLCITKTGTGTWNLQGINTFTGNTTVSNGTLIVSGTIGGGTGSPTVVAGGTLAGTVAIADQVNVLAGGTLTPDANGVPGTMTISNNLVLFGTAAVTLNKLLAQSNSVFVVSGVITNAGGGAIVVNNIGPALVLGDTFTLFSQAVSNGAAMTITPAPGPGLGWQNNLALNGSLSVVSSGPGVFTNATGITRISINGANVTLNATNGQAGCAYYLLESTNVALPRNQWTAVATNVLGASGAYMFIGTNVVTTGANQQFYLLSNTNN